ncbi:protoporphyrinogen oxidase [Kurthia sibirica]|uniref:Coproporphyrinogen III oxidase n=1 Tax=Kurthia sibirica TaxID=202750 RepID=A0A2U3AJF0_9BACL|nr:protoporphyrinogen oxidase [Kurthia sibirica]PWI24669.1 protoporphyrinogen oxidase [Kurthia sibirica]
MTKQLRRVAIIGGGITGLAAAYRLQQQAREQQLPIEIVLIESFHRFGGKIHTVLTDNIVFEKGPESFVDRLGIIEELASSLGISDQLVHSIREDGYVAVNEDLYAVPKGVVFGVPTQMKPFMTSDLVSWSGKARATLDFLRPQKKVDVDQSLGKLMRKRFGEEVVDNIVEPLLSGVFNGDIDELSYKATLPFLQNEEVSKSLIQGVRTYTQQSDNMQFKRQRSTFLGGLSTLVDELVKQLTDVKLVKGVRVTAIKKLGDQLMLSLNNDTSIKIDGVIIATPHTVAQQLIKESELLASLNDIPLNSVATVSMSFDLSQLPKSFKGTDIFVSRNSDVSITSATLSSRIWSNIAPKDKLLIRAYIGKLGDEAIVDLSDKEIEKLVLQDLQLLVGLTGQPQKTIVTRWKHSMPQYTIGHTDKVKLAKQKLAIAYPTIRLAGNSYEGISLSKCVTQANDSADELLHELYQNQL